MITAETKVKRLYKNAVCKKDSFGKYYIAVPDSPFSLIDDEFDLESFLDGDTNKYINLLEEYLIPNKDTEEEAWTSALLSCKVTQNFNRTHPDRVSLDHEDEDRIIRLSERSDRIQRSKQLNQLESKNEHT